MPYRRRALVGAAAVLVTAACLTASEPHRVETVQTYMPRPQTAWAGLIRDEHRQEAAVAAQAAEASRTVQQAKIERLAALQARIRRASRSASPGSTRPSRPVLYRAPSTPSRGSSGPCVGGWREMKDRAAKRQRAVDCWWAKIVGYGWNGAQAFEVMWCESKGDPEAHNSSDHNGLFQVHHGPYDADQNLALAWSMYQRRGWGPWVSSKSCWG